MIVRIWRAQANHSGAVSYRRHFEQNVMPELVKTRGFIAAQLLSRESDEKIFLEVQTQWDCLDSIRAFAKDDLDAAVVDPEAIAVLLDFDRKVQHFESVVYTA